MTREEAKVLLPIIQAYAEGKNIQYNSVTSGWCDITESEGLPMGFLEEKPSYFRIKKKFTYRPFANAEECWKEMEKHQPFGWMKHKKDGSRSLITSVIGYERKVYFNEDGWYFDRIMEHYTFADDAPFGVKVVEE